MLPGEHIQPMYERMAERINDDTDHRLKTLFQYVGNTWMENSVWHLHELSIYREVVRTNNDVEGMTSVYYNAQ